MTGFYPSRIKLILGLAAFCPLAMVAAYYAGFTGMYVMAGLGGTGAALILFALVKIHQMQHRLEKAQNILSYVQSGDFESRISPIYETGPLADFFYTINDIIDQADAFAREAVASLNALGNNRYNRHIQIKGMRGYYQTASNTINDTVTNTKRQVDHFHDISESFETNVGQAIDGLNDRSGHLAVTADQLKSAAGQLNQQASEVAAASEEASTNVSAVASAGEEMNASIKEIARQTGQSSDITNKAIEQAKQADEKISELSKTADEVEDIIEIINDIAEQTNLLALNATIEAARAGEAGKGFAVVAGEVKQLASQTTKATETITERINRIQTSTGGAVEAIGNIESVIQNLAEISANISAAVEQQDAATAEIAQNIEEAAEGTKQVTRNVTAVSAGAAQTDNSAKELQTASTDISSQSERISSQVERLLKELKSVV